MFSTVVKKNDFSHFRKEYSESRMEERFLELDPFDQFAIWFEDTIKAGIEEPTAMFLATSGENGIPSGRIVLLKSFDRKGFVFYTNYLSRKGKEIRENQWVSLTFFWKEVERQVRITGKAIKVSRNESDEYFYSRPFESRISACISSQSNVIPDRNFLENLRNKYLEDLKEKEVKRPKNWGGYRVVPIRFEFWQGRELRLHDRIQYRKTKLRWIMERLAP